MLLYLINLHQNCSSFSSNYTKKILYFFELFGKKLMKKFRILLERIPEINTSEKPGNIFVAFNGELELELAFYGRKKIYI